MPEASGPSTLPDPTHGVHVDPAGQLAFMDRQLLRPDTGFVFGGGAKLKLVLGATGAGKTHFLRAALEQAATHGFLTVTLDAASVPLAGFDQLYRAVVASLDLAGLATGFITQTLQRAGYQDLVLAPGQTLGAWCAATGHEVAPLKVRLQEELHRNLERNPNLDLAYAIGLTRWCEQLAWGPPPEASLDEGLTERWLRGEPVAQRDCNRLRLRRCLDRFQARLWLRSLVHFVRQAGFPGVAVAIDNLAVLLTKQRPLEPVSEQAHGGRALPPHYTPQKRADFYEMLRTVIDEMGLLPGLLLLLAGPAELLTDDGRGMASYEALAARLRTEIDAAELNRFADIILLERLWAADPAAGRQLAEQLAARTFPDATPDMRERAVAAAMAQWQVQNVDVSAVRRSVLAALQAAEGGAA